MLFGNDAKATEYCGMIAFATCRLLSAFPSLRPNSTSTWTTHPTMSLALNNSEACSDYFRQNSDKYFLAQFHTNALNELTVRCLVSATVFQTLLGLRRFGFTAALV